MKLKAHLVLLKPDRRLFKLNIPVIGITGGVASGKSTVAKFFQDKGIGVISADALVKDIYALPETLELFKSEMPQYLLPDGKIDFVLMRKDFFKDPALQKRMTDYIYPKLLSAFNLRLKELMPVNLIVYEIPLLFERKLQEHIDHIICVHTPDHILRERLILRDKISLETAQQMLASQLPIDEKKKLSHTVIDNSGKPEVTLKQLEDFFQKSFDT